MDVEKALKDPKTRKAIIEVLKKDEDLIRELAQEIFSTKCEDIGLNSPGSLLDFFRNDW